MMKFEVKKYKPLFIAEISANHNGSLAQAIRLIKTAKKYGADAVKLQTYTPDTMTIKSSNSDFKIELNDVVEVEAGTKCYLSSIVIPNTWYTIEDNNDRLYVRINNSSDNSSTDYIIYLSHKNYDLTSFRAELENKFGCLRSFV